MLTTTDGIFKDKQLSCFLSAAWTVNWRQNIVVHLSPRELTCVILAAENIAFGLPSVATKNTSINVNLTLHTFVNKQLQIHSTYFFGKGFFLPNWCNPVTLVTLILHQYAITADIRSPKGNLTLKSW